MVEVFSGVAFRERLVGGGPPPPTKWFGLRTALFPLQYLYQKRRPPNCVHLRISQHPNRNLILGSRFTRRVVKRFPDCVH